MTNTRKNKRWLSLLVAMMVIFSFSLSSVSAASSLKVRTFRIRESGTYNLIGTVTITASGSNVNTSKSGTIRFNTTVHFTNSSGHDVYIYSGTVLKYSINKMKDGETITMSYKSGDPGCDMEVMGYKLTGKIHIEGHDMAFLWKIDTIKLGNKSVGFYFRNT